MRSTSDLATAYEQWLSETRQAVIERVPERKDEFATSSGIPFDPLGMPSERDYLTELNFPGEYPYTRGVQPTMYRSRLWTMRQYAGFGSAEESNARYRFLLARGQSGLSVAFDLPTQIGYDPDHALALGEVGKSGVSISTLDDMVQLFLFHPHLFL